MAANLQYGPFGRLRGSTQQQLLGLQLFHALRPCAVNQNLQAYKTDGGNARMLSAAKINWIAVGF